MNEKDPVIPVRTIATPLPPVSENLIRRRPEIDSEPEVSGLPKRQGREARVTAGDTDGQNVAPELGKAILSGLAALPAQQVMEPITWQDLVFRSGADGSSGADCSGHDPEMMQDYLDRINGEEQ